MPPRLSLMKIADNVHKVETFNVHPEPADLQTNDTFIALADVEFAENRSGKLF